VTFQIIIIPCTQHLQCNSTKTIQQKADGLTSFFFLLWIFTFCIKLVINMIYQARQRWQPSIMFTMHLSTKFILLYISWDSTWCTFRDIFWTVHYDTMFGKSQQIKVKTFTSKKMKRYCVQIMQLHTANFMTMNTRSLYGIYKHSKHLTLTQASVPSKKNHLLPADWFCTMHGTLIHLRHSQKTELKQTSDKYTGTPNVDTRT